MTSEGVERQEAEPEGEAVEGEAQAQDELAAARALADEYLRGWQRAQADFANYKRRAQQEREELERQGNAELLLQILPALDDFDRALAALPGDERGDSAAWSAGIVNIVRKLEDALDKQGLKRIEAVGREFDPTEHEAVLNVPVPSEQDGIVTAEVRKGYRFHDRVLRPAQVVVGKAPEVGGPEESA